MTPFDDLIKGLRKYKTLKYLRNEFKRGIRLRSDDILDLVEARLKRGDGVNGGVIGRYANEKYELFKAKLNPMAGGAVDLILTGSTVEKLFLGEKGGDFIIKSADEKYGMLAEKYGAEQFGITEDEKEKILSEITENIVEKIIEEIYGK